jgi:2'-5' RNA ligase
MGVFLGWMPDAATQAALAALRSRIQEALPAGAPRHDWRGAAQWHVTLRYLGETVDAAQRARVDAAMRILAAGQPAVDATLVGAQYWPHARVLVAKVAPSEALAGLIKRLESTMQACGFARERPQTAHLTLAYLPRVATPPALPTLAMAQPLRMDRVDLLQTAPGAYAALASWPLAGLPAG